jgi:thiol:disulfide interchange protein DsbD
MTPEGPIRMLRRPMNPLFRQICRAFGVALALAGAVQAQTSSSSPVERKSGLNAILGTEPASGEEEFLDPDVAFQLIADADGPDRIRVHWTIHEGYYLYKSRVKVATASDKVKLGAVSLPTGEKKTDDYFGEQEVFHNELVASVPVSRAPGSAVEVPLDVTYQGCAEAGLCYPPITKTLNVSLPAPDAAAGGYESEQDFLARVLRNGNLAIVLGTFFLVGLGLSFTACVLPMIPILSGIIVGHGGTVTPWRGFSLAMTYVQGMALTYAAAGAAFVLAFRQTPQAFFQQPWIVITFAALFVALALSMFGLYTLQMPSAVQTRLMNLSNKQKSGTFIGTFVMGALSALIVTACVAPAVIGALSVISQTGEVGRGAGALYAMALGMGAPLLAVGASAGSLLPRVGPWMDTVKSLFGVVFLGVAIYFLRNLLPPSVSMLLWSVLAVVTGLWIFSLKKRDGSPAPAPVRAFGLIALLYGVILLVGVSAGSSDPLQPLKTLRASSAPAAAAESPTVAARTDNALPFERVKSLAELQQRVAAASAAGRPVMLDFYADWCVSCKEMEHDTFTDPVVQQALSNAVLLQVDVTANNSDDRALFQHFGIFGPPTIAFYDASGQERRAFRVVGFMEASKFVSVVRQAFGDSAT